VAQSCKQALMDQEEVENEVLKDHRAFKCETRAFRAHAHTCAAEICRSMFLEYRRRSAPRWLGRLRPRPRGGDP
jgi:hypothetical protein